MTDRSAAERIHWLEKDIERKDAAIDAALLSLTKLSKTGSLHKSVREYTIRRLLEARNERLF